VPSACSSRPEGRPSATRAAAAQEAAGGGRRDASEVVASASSPAGSASALAMASEPATVGRATASVPAAAAMAAYAPASFRLGWTWVRPGWPGEQTVHPSLDPSAARGRARRPPALLGAAGQGQARHVASCPGLARPGWASRPRPRDESAAAAPHLAAPVGARRRDPCRQKTR
jgi:hypothetical protein